MDWVRKSVRHLRDVLRRRGLPRQDLEDVIQDAFLRMQIYCSEGHEVRNPEAFLVRTAINLSVNSQSRQREHLSVEGTKEDLSGVLGLEPSPDEVLVADESLRHISAQIESMTPRTREIFLLHYVDEYTYPQIAKQLGISVSAIEKHMARALLKLTGEE